MCICMDSFSSIISIFVAVIIIFIYPLLYLAQKQDMITEVYVSNETTYFVNNLRNKGYLSLEMYQNYIDNLSATRNVYDVKITHSKKMVNLEYDEETKVFLDKYYTSYIEYYEDEIIEVLDKGMDYSFSQGDYVNIKVVNISPTLAVRIMRALYRTNIATEQILITYGGLIRDESS